jgi:hypothetical protein
LKKTNVLYEIKLVLRFLVKVVESNNQLDLKKKKEVFIE